MLPKSENNTFDLLVEEFPNLYKPKGSEISFYLPIGWYPLVRKLSKDINVELENNPELKSKFKILQVKEKFGGLRFYLSESVSENIDALIAESEELSMDACISCGANVCGKKSIIKKLFKLSWGQSTFCAKHLLFKWFIQNNPFTNIDNFLFYGR